MMDRNTQAWKPSGAMGSMLEPRVEAARRVLGRQRYPVEVRADLDIIDEGAGGAALLTQVLRVADFPLASLRQGLAVLELRLRDRGLELPELTADSVASDRLEGGDPATRAARLVYRTLRRRSRDLGMRRSLARREAHDQACRFRELCQRWLPVDDFVGFGAQAALHAWAQCYAREFIDSPTVCGPTAACEEAAGIALRMTARVAQT